MIREKIQSSINVKQTILNNQVLIDKIQAATDKITVCFQNKQQVFFCGNGGSAADAQHLAAEFSGQFYLNRPGLPAIAMHCNSSYLTAVGNDLGYDKIYSRLLESSARQGDILIGLSTSGNSANILEAFRKAREMGIYTIAFTGESGGLLKDLSDILLNIPSSDTPRIQESHITIGHIICEAVEQNLFA